MRIVGEAKGWEKQEKKVYIVERLIAGEWEEFYPPVFGEWNGEDNLRIAQRAYPNAEFRLIERLSNVAPGDF